MPRKPVKPVDRIYNDNSDCVGCGAYTAAYPCHPTCPFITGIIEPPVVLRAAGEFLPDRWPDDHDLRDALATASQHLVNPEHVAETHRAAYQTLIDYLNGAFLPACGTIRPLTRPAHDADNRRFVRLTLYAASAAHDGYQIDPDDIP